jgi:hypothetical protein
MKRDKAIWTAVILISLYVTFQLTADVTAAKQFTLFGLSMPAGTLIFALTFTWRDLLHKRLGAQWAIAAIVMAAVANLFMVAYFLLAIGLPPASFWPNQEAFSLVLGIVPRIAVASIAAELISQIIDTGVYQVFAKHFTNRQQWMRVLASNTISLPVDSFIFATLAFAGTMPVSGLWSLVQGQIVFKAAVTLLSLPLIYLVSNRQNHIDRTFATLTDTFAN